MHVETIQRHLQDSTQLQFEYALKEKVYSLRAANETERDEWYEVIHAAGTAPHNMDCPLWCNAFPEHQMTPITSDWVPCSPPPPPEESNPVHHRRAADRPGRQHAPEGAEAVLRSVLDRGHPQVGRGLCRGRQPRGGRQPGRVDTVSRGRADGGRFCHGRR